MLYAALGDSISVDDYTDVPAGGAASQFARMIGTSEFQMLARGGNTTDGVLSDLMLIQGKPDVITLTVGGNDLLRGQTPHAISVAIRMIALSLAGFGCPVIMSTMYDPTDGDDALAPQIGLPSDLRLRFNALNHVIKATARQHGFGLADLEVLFHGHGAAAPEPWLVCGIEPNHTGATAIAEHWHDVLAGAAESGLSAAER